MKLKITICDILTADTNLRLVEISLESHSKSSCRFFRFINRRTILKWVYK